MDSYVLQLLRVHKGLHTDAPSHAHSLLDTWPFKAMHTCSSKCFACACRLCAGSCAQILDKSHSGTAHKTRSWLLAVPRGNQDTSLPPVEPPPGSERFREAATTNEVGHWVSLACNSEEPHLISTRSVSHCGPYRHAGPCRDDWVQQRELTMPYTG